MSQIAPLEGSPQFGGNSYTREKDCHPLGVRNMATGLGTEAPSMLGPGEVVADIWLVPFIPSPGLDCGKAFRITVSGQCLKH